jgi:hypothetical protein
MTNWNLNFVTARLIASSSAVWHLRRICNAPVFCDHRKFSEKSSESIPHTICSCSGGFLMRFEKLIAITLVSVGLSLVGCGSHVEIAPSESGGNGGSGNGGGGNGESGNGGSSNGGSGNGGSGGGSVSAFCANACITAVDGTCFPTAACIDYCEANASGWAPEVAKAFAACAADNPLCFETVPNCILGKLHATGTSHPVRLEGSGFAEYEGKHLIVWNDPGVNIPFGGDVMIVGGKFSFEWFEPVAVSDTGTSLLLMYIDIDGNGSCNPAADITASVSPQWNGDYLNPIFTATLTIPLADPDFVCSFPP